MTHPIPFELVVIHMIEKNAGTGLVGLGKLRVCPRRLESSCIVGEDEIVFGAYLIPLVSNAYS
jgi:hypothetical protein